MRTVIIIIVAGVLAACATMPKTYEFERAREYSASKDQIWSRLMELLTSQNIQIKTVEKDSGIVYAERFYGPEGAKFLDFADCGLEIGNTPAGRPTAGMNVFVVEIADNRTRVTVNTNFQMPVLVYAVIANVLEHRTCNSKGTLERRILDQLAL